MSDNWIILISENPRFVPEEQKRIQALSRFEEIVFDADEISAIIYPQIQFFDCGGNFDRVLCPSCHAVLDDIWWQDRMAEDDRDGYQLTAFSVPCCGTVCKLNDLDYHWPQGFGRFALDAMNPGIDTLDDQDRQQLEGILETKLKVIYQHL